MATSNVEFYERMQGLQKQQHGSEQQRMELEHKLRTFLSSDNRLSRLKAVKLQRLWEKVCEDEKRSKARNQQLLSDYYRVEAHVAALSTRTERLRLLKDQYERQVELMYPKWREKLEAKRLQQQFTQQRKQQQGGALYGQSVINGATYVPQSAQDHPSMPNGTTHLGPLSQLAQPSMKLQQHAQVYSPMPNGACTRLSQQIPQPSMQLPQHARTYSPMSNGTISFGLSQPIPHHGQLPQHAQGHPPMHNGTTSFRPSDQLPQLTTQLPTSEPLYAQTMSTVPHTDQSGVSESQMLSGDESIYSHSSFYDKLNRTNSQVPAPIFDGSRGNYTQLMQDHRTGLELGSMKPSVTQSEDYSHLIQMPQNRSRGSDNQLSVQGYQQQPQQVRQQLNHQIVCPGQYRPKADSVGETSSTISVSSVSHYSEPDIRPWITCTAGNQQETKGNKRSVYSYTDNHVTLGNDVQIAENQDKNQHRSIKKAGNNNDDYLAPVTANAPAKDNAHVSSISAQRDSGEQLSNGKVPVSLRTEPFSSEGEQGKEEEDEEEEKDEDSAALSDALQDQLANTENPAVRVEVIKHDSLEEMPNPTGYYTREAHDEQAENSRKDNQIVKMSKTEEEDSGSEIGSDMSLPLSNIDPRESQSKPTGHTWTVGQDTTGRTSRISEDITHPTLTTKGFWLLTHVVEMEIEQSENISGLYNSTNCSDAIWSDIIQSANQNKHLSRLDPNAVSMVIIQTLPSLVDTLPGGCLMSDKLLSSKRRINEVTVRSFNYSAALEFWDKLLRHLKVLMKKGELEPDEVATRFAPHLISRESNMADKAVEVLRQILEDLQDNESFLDDSSSVSLPTPKPAPRKQSDAREKENQKYLKVPLLDLGGDTDRSDESEDTGDDNDSFFDNKVPLTETSAYQRMLGNTFTADVATPGTKESADSEDDIEKAAQITPHSPSSAGNKKKRNVLSSLGGGSVGLSYRSDEEEVENNDDRNKLKSTGGSGTIQISDQVSAASHSDTGSSPSPPGTGYIPSAMEHSMKSTARSDVHKRSAAFWGDESDMESEISIPMGTGNKSEENQDDFDFYD